MLVGLAAFGAQAQLRVLPNGTILTGHLLINEGFAGDVVPANNLLDDWGTITIDTTYNRDAAMHLFGTKTDGIAFAAFGRGQSGGKLIIRAKNITINSSFTAESGANVTIEQL